MEAVMEVLEEVDSSVMEDMGAVEALEIVEMVASEVEMEAVALEVSEASAEETEAVASVEEMVVAEVEMVEDVENTIKA